MNTLLIIIICYKKTSRYKKILLYNVQTQSSLDYKQLKRLCYMYVSCNSVAYSLHEVSTLRVTSCLSLPTRNKMQVGTLKSVAMRA